MFANVIRSVVVTAALVGAGAVLWMVALIELSMATQIDNGWGGFGLILNFLAAPFIAFEVGLDKALLALCVAAVTLPTTLGLAGLLRLQRPFVDVLGGACAGWALATAVSARTPSAALMDTLLGDRESLALALAVIGGAVLGWIRYKLVSQSEADKSEPHQALPAYGASDSRPAGEGG